jgi:hypothetical protein
MPEPGSDMALKPDAAPHGVSFDVGGFGFACVFLELTYRFMLFYALAS